MTATVRAYPGAGAGAIVPACERCDHAQREVDGAGNFGGLSCRANPPQVVMAEQQLPPGAAMQVGRKTAWLPLSVFPPVAPTSWCAHYADALARAEFNG